jgi:hypothetical protein
MLQQITSEQLSQNLEPLCPRDNHRMRYEGKGIHWKWEADDSVHTVASYHCDFEGCSVRYNHTDGYFSVVDTPDHPFFVEEPGVNILQCPRHGAWLHRSRYENNNNNNDALEWRCGVEGCDYVRADGAS